MTNYDKLKAAFPKIDTRSDQLRRLCPVPFIGCTFCLKPKKGSGMLPREVYDNTSLVCIDCANAYWAFDEDDPKYTKVFIEQVDAIDITDAVKMYDKANGVCALYNLGHISLNDLKTKLDALDFNVIVKKTSFVEFQKELDQKQSKEAPLTNEGLPNQMSVTSGTTSEIPRQS